MDLPYTPIPQIFNKCALSETIGIIVNAQHKGGVGKTTTTLIQAHFLAELRGKRVLIIDLDKQANLSNCYLKMEREKSYGQDVSNLNFMPPVHPDHEEGDYGTGRHSFVDIFRDNGNGECLGLFPYKTMYENIDILPAHSSVIEQFSSNDMGAYTALFDDDSTVEDQLIAFATKPAYKAAFREKVRNHVLYFLNAIRENEKSCIDDPDDAQVRPAYDYIIIDTPPDKNILIEAVIRAADHIIIPFEVDSFSEDGMFSMFYMIDQQNKKRVELGMPEAKKTLLPNRFISRETSRLSTLASLGDKHGHEMAPIIKHNIQLNNLKTDSPNKVSFVRTIPESKPAYQNAVEAMSNIFDKNL